MVDERPTLLLVDDEANITALFEAWLADDYEVRTANDGDAALAAMDDSVAVVLLDRRMPGRSGDEILTSIRERGYDAKVAMVTAVEPDFDVVDMGFDDYLTKPVERADLESTVESLLARKRYDEEVQEYYALAAKKAALEASKPTSELLDNPDYNRLLEAIGETESTIDGTLRTPDDFAAAFRDL